MTFNSLKDIYVTIKNKGHNIYFDEINNEIILSSQFYKITVLNNEPKIDIFIIYGRSKYNYKISRPFKYKEVYNFLMRFIKGKNIISKYGDYHIRINRWRNREISLGKIIFDMLISTLGVCLLFIGFIFCCIETKTFSESWSPNVNYAMMLLIEMVAVFFGTIFMYRGSYYILQSDTILYFRGIICFILFFALIIFLLFIDNRPEPLIETISAVAIISVFSVPLMFHMLLLCFDTIIEKKTEA
ncbi:MAG: hypothetical protein IJ167_05385 [Lachnospiraceae bacterium]|nr:hypothetical protein [Lachnospiraceae bacterium]